MKEENSLSWKYPDIDDTKTIFDDQIVQVKAVGEWNVKQNVRDMKNFMCRAFCVTFHSPSNSTWTI